MDGRVLYSREGTTQGDPLAMPMCTLATLYTSNKRSCRKRQASVVRRRCLAPQLVKSRDYNYTNGDCTRPPLWLLSQCHENMASHLRKTPPQLPPNLQMKASTLPCSKALGKPEFVPVLLRLQQGAILVLYSGQTLLGCSHSTSRCLRGMAFQNNKWTYTF